MTHLTMFLVLTDPLGQVVVCAGRGADPLGTRGGRGGRSRASDRMEDCTPGTDRTRTCVKHT